MIAAAIAVLILEGLMRLFDNSFRKQIENSNSVENSLELRRKLKNRRAFLSIGLIVILLAIVVIIAVMTDNEESIGSSIGIILGYVLIKGVVARLRGNVQASNKEDYLKDHQRFVLYLRAFESDYYSTDPNSYSFEYGFAKTISKKLDTNICAIGMTKEVDAPRGATRVYVSDESWQADVKELMQKASMIFILMSDRQSCIWEIAQSVDMLHKTCFLIDNEHKYENIRKELRPTITFPEYGELSSKLNDDILKEKLENNVVKIGLMLNGDSYSVVEIDEAEKESIRKVFDVIGFE